jgi:hypothetical protein
MVTRQPADETFVGFINRTALCVPPRYIGPLSKGERARVLRLAADDATEVLRADPRARADAADFQHVEAFRRTFGDLLWLGLSYGLVPSDMGETVRAVADALAIERGDVRELLLEMRACVDRYREIAEETPEPFWWCAA